MILLLYNLKNSVLVSLNDDQASLLWGVMAERIREPNASSGVSDQRSVGSSLSRDTCVPEQDTLLHPGEPVRAEMVLVIDLAEWRIFVAQAVSSSQGA